MHNIFQRLFVIISLSMIIVACSNEDSDAMTSLDPNIENNKGIRQIEQSSSLEQDKSSIIPPSTAGSSGNKSSDGSTNIPKKRVHSYFVEEDDNVFGDPESNIVVLEYFSLTCDACLNYHTNIFPMLKKKYIDTNKIAYIIREFVFSKQELDGAILARCTGDIGSYEKFINILLKQKNGWAFKKNYRDVLTNIGSLGGISSDQYVNCLNDKNLRDVLFGKTRFIFGKPGGRAAPALFINGKHLSRLDFNTISKEIDKYLSDEQ